MSITRTGLPAGASTHDIGRTLRRNITALLDIKSQLLIPFALGMLIFVGAIGFGTFLSKSRQLDERIDRKFYSTQVLLQSEFDRAAEFMLAILDATSRNSEYREAFLAGDRQVLIEAAAPFFHKLSENNGITHFYFSGPDRKNLVRLHRTSLHGDTIDRHGTLEAERTGKPTVGFELGKYHAYHALRVVFPWYYEGELIGYLELARRIDQLARIVKSETSMDVIVLLAKKNLVQEYWENGMLAKHKVPRWNQFPDHVIVDQTIEALPRSFSLLLSESDFAPPSGEFPIEADGRSHMLRFFPLRTGGGDLIGYQAILMETTRLTADLYKAVASVTAIGAGIAIALIVFSFLFISGLEKQIRQSSTQLRLQSAALESAANAIVITDQGGTITWANSAFLTLSGYEDEECIGRNLSLVSSGVHDQAFIGELWETIVRGDVWHGELFNKKKDGTIYHEEMTITPVEDHEGAISHYIAIKQDISDRKRQESALREARDEALQASKSKSEFLANMSHEIRTPLNGIIGMTDLTLETELTREQTGNLKTLKSSADSLLAVINDILDFSKIEAGKLELEPIPFNMRELIGETLRAHGVIAHEKGLELAWHVDPEVPDRLVGDSNRLRQILVNLVGNALKFTEEGEVLVNVSLVGEDSTSLMLNFVVHDTGIGIKYEKQREIFESFTQADGSTTRKYGGTGLGLTICQSLVQIMGGRIKVESTPGHGTQFSFTCRLDSAPPVESAELERSIPDLQSKKILVVDDNATNCLILEEMLGLWGISVETVPSAPDALIEVTQAIGTGMPFDLLLLDYMMPEIDGLDLAEQVMEAFGDDSPHMLLLSSALHIPKEKYTSVGIESTLSKPIKQSDLFDAIMSVFKDEASGVEISQAIESKIETKSPEYRILIAEDNAVNQLVATKILEREGHTVRVVPDGQQAVRAFEEEHFDLILMDVQMPKMGGYEATSKIRALESGRPSRTPIIALTANAMKGDRERCMAADMDDYLSKPVKAEALRSIVTRHLDGVPPVTALEIKAKDPV